MRELTTQTGIVVKCSKTAIEFFQNAQSVDFFSALEIPKEFQDIAVEFYDRQFSLRCALPKELDILDHSISLI